MGDRFRTYERTKVERVEVATITEGNIHLIAKAANARVDYSGDEPVILTDIREGKVMRWKLGWTVSLFGDRLTNMNGFDRDGDWRLVDD